MKLFSTRSQQVTIEQDCTDKWTARRWSGSRIL